MARSCEICGKGPLTGNKVSHSNNRSKKKSMPNLQRQKVLLKGQPKRIYVCTRCLRSGSVQKAM